MHKNLPSCMLCAITTVEYYDSYLNRTYYNCNRCGCVFTKNLPNRLEEKTRYLKHNNDVENKGFQKFVSPIVTAVKNQFSKLHKGLDFGAGTGPVITKILEESGYKITLYDPFFHPNKKALETRYDFIICCEVIEHFHHPLQEFKVLKSLLEEKGVLYCMTDLLPPKKAFKSWYYKNDPTHVIFYTPKTLEWIKENVGFKKLSIKDRLITFS